MGWASRLRPAKGSESGIDPMGIATGGMPESIEFEAGDLQREWP